MPYWEGQAPEYDEDGALQGIDKGGVRVARAGLTVKDDTMGIKVMKRFVYQKQYQFVCEWRPLELESALCIQSRPSVRCLCRKH